MAKIFTNAETQPVYYQMGVNSVTGKMQYKRAPFDVVKINGALHLQPRSVGAGNDLAVTQYALGSIEDQNNWRDNDLGGYETLEPIIINENQMGDGSDNWFGLHSFSTL